MDINALRDRRIKLVNAEDSTLTINEPELKINRTLRGINAAITLPGDQVKELLESSIGFKNMIEQGMIMIENKEDRIALELEENGINVPVYFKKDDMVKLLRGVAYPDFVKQVEAMTKEQRNMLADLAIAEEITDLAKTDLLKKYTERDIIKTIMLARDMKADQTKK